MALSGTLDTFALPDVLRLLASTAKTGRLRITGDRGSGSVWVEAGDVVAAELASAVSQEPTPGEVVFGLLRFSAGSFTFEADATAPNASTPKPLEPVLGEAENMLVEWRAIEEVISSLDVWVGLRPALEGPDVMVDQKRWSGIAAIGSGAQVGSVAETLRLNEIDSCRLVKELLELGLVEFIDEPAGAPEVATFEPQPIDEADFVETSFADAGESSVFEDETPGDPEALLHELDAMEDAPSFGDADQEISSDNTTEPSLGALVASEDSVDPLVSSADSHDGWNADADIDSHDIDPHDIDVDDIDTQDRDREDSDSEEAFAVAPGGADADELNPAEMARQLANLSPKAAKAVAAAAKATTEAERDAALAAVEAEDDTVNRGLLLKFLGSVDS